MTAETTDAPSACPHCGGGAPIPIVYGLPGPDLFEEAERGEVALGGCVVWEGRPLWHCSACGHGFGGTTEDARKTG
ncbi:hypothetical protein BJF79_38230 [Actinomadura sp. CNU-125]|uniref:hypothetical protein n=1 Tax=Actinomadura sp. CNU-125 TaxID=1904961 RepID=UPI0009629489|nr:hypothetical protein [Actinomadura sp. CNU-125]OLT30759.1 hypothetical protein BJF79_38230 [Actinomadura sp. CNU-125]